jgi:hypothetical protein
MFKVVVDPCVAINKTLLDLELVLGTFFILNKTNAYYNQYMNANV